MLSFLQYIAESAKEAPGIIHTEHVADRTFDGSVEAHHAINTLYGVINNKVPITRKIDDKMSFQTKRDGTGKVGVKYKGTGSTYNYSEADIEKQHGHKPYLAGPLKHVLKHVGKVLPKAVGEYQGGFMSTPDSRKETDGKIEHTPNTLSYSVHKNSEEGKKLAKSKVSLTIHTKLVGPKKKAVPITDTSGFESHPDVHMVDHTVSKSEQSISKKQKEDILSHVNAAKEHMKTHSYDHLQGHSANLRTYVNSTVDSGETPSVEGYKKHVSSKYNREIEKLKSDKGKSGKINTRDDSLSKIESNKDAFKKTFAIHHHIQTATNMLANSLNDTAAGSFDHHIGGKKSGPEGFVAKGLKIVNRQEFSKANREKGALLKGKK